MTCPICQKHSCSPVFDVFDDRYGYPDLFPLLKCTQCKHQHLQHRFKPEDIPDLYTRYYTRANLAKKRNPLPAPTGFKSWFNGTRRAYAFVPAKVRVLDIGCGAGDTLIYHRQRGCESYGVEPDDNVRSFALDDKLNIQIGTFDHSMFERGFFDYVTMDQVLEHTIDPLKTLQDVSTVLAANGRIALTVPHGLGWGARIFGRKWINWHTPYHLHQFSKRSISHILNQAGFEIEVMKTHTNSDWLHYQWLHMLYFPKLGQPSVLWAPDRIQSRQRIRVQKIKRFLNRLHRWKLNHLITRFFDSLGLGDNLLVVARKRTDNSFGSA
jgi:SAM-dependent methyltransferase